jgi:uncharacterized protein with GYD domain
MSTYIILGHFTDQGVRGAKDTVKRADAFKALAKQHGVTVRETFWTLGAFDVVSIVDSQDDEGMTALGLSMGVLGNVRTQTLRAFDAAAMTKVIGKMK